jgi:endonuclease YncB( thermonuclease family)
VPAPTEIRRIDFILVLGKRATVVKLGRKPKSKGVFVPRAQNAGKCLGHAAFGRQDLSRAQNNLMTRANTRSSSRCREFATIALACGMMQFVAGGAVAAGCTFPPQGEGRVAAILDARSFRLEDGREIRLAGIEQDAEAIPALSAIVAGREVTLRGEDDAPDRYGRQPAFVFVGASEVPVQAQLLAQGAALVSSGVADRDCAALLMAAEAEARRAKQGIWANPTAIKSAESPGDILAGTGRFTIVEGKVLSVRQAGATTYLNFGRNWTRDFAVTISRRMLAAFESAGIAPKSLENRRIRVRGWVEARGGPRIEALHVGQVELLGEN